MVAIITLIADQVQWNDSVVNENGHQTTSRGALSSFEAADGVFLFFSVCLLLIAHLFAALRWRILLLAHRIRIGIKDIVKLSFMGNFLSLLMPGLLGGDGVKAFLVAKQTDRKSHAIISSFTDRLFGLFGFIIQSTIMLVILWLSSMGDSESLYLPAITTAVLIGAMTGLILGIRLIQKFEFPRGLKFVKKLPTYPYFQGAGKAFYVYRNKGWLFCQVLGLTGLTQAFAISSVVLVGVSMDLSIKWYLYFMYVPLIIIVSAVPLTPGGVGIMEELYLLYFSGFESNSELLVLALLVRVTNILSILPGGIVLLVGPKFSKKDIMVETRK